MKTITARVRNFERLNPNAFAYVLYLDADGEEIEVYATSSTACKDVIETCRTYDFDITECEGKTVCLKAALNRSEKPPLPPFKPLGPGMPFPDPKSLELIMDDIDRQIFILEAEERFKKDVLLIGDTICGKVGDVETAGEEYSFKFEMKDRVETCHVIPGIASTVAVNTLAGSYGKSIKLYGVHTPHGFFVHKICK